MKKSNICKYLLVSLALIIIFISCDNIGSIAGDMDEIWQEVIEGRSYTVTFNANGGAPVPSPQSIPYGGKAVQPENPVKEDYFFVEWIRADGAVWDFGIDIVTKDITLYAKWETVPEGALVVIFQINGAIQRPANRVVMEGEKVPQPDNPERASGRYIFDKWYGNSNYTNPWDFTVNTVSLPGPLELYGNWIDPEYGIDEYPIRFKMNGGSPVPADQVKRIGDLVDEPDMSQISKGDSTFGGWYKDAALTEPWFFDEDSDSKTPATLVSGTTAIYAQWNPKDNYTVNFITNGGEPVPDQQIVAKGEEVIEPGADPVKTNYDFDGWYWHESASRFSEWVFSSDIVSSNLFLYAKWKPLTYIVEFDPNWPDPSEGSSGTMASQEFAYDEAQNLNANGFSLTSHTFTGWNTKADGSGTSYTDGQNLVIEKDAVGITLYAQWAPNLYTVSFDTNGGSEPPPSQTVYYNGKATRPSPDPTNTGAASSDLPAGLYRNIQAFVGWYNGEVLWDFSTDVVSDDMILKAKWDGNVDPISLTGVAGANIVEQAVNYINSDPDAYTLLLGADVPSVTYQILTGSGIKLTLLGKDSARTITLSGTAGSLFTVNSGVNLVLDSNITLQGTENTASLVKVNSGGRLEMKGNAIITGNSIAIYSTGGGGVYVDGGTFDMSGGTISGNAVANEGGGVYVGNSGIFDMSGGTISDNTAGFSGGGVFFAGSSLTMSGSAVISSNAVNSSSLCAGGGVYVADGTFTMNGGTISDNTAFMNVMSFGDGGGVYLQWGSFTMNDGTISGNTAGSSGGGVFFVGSSFTMSGGTISGNTASNSGGGVYTLYDFTMNGGTISGNTASNGGGVCMSSVGRFIMSGGIITGNTAGEYGGGVYVSGDITKTGGTITGYNSDPNNGNVVRDGSGVLARRGHAVYYYYSSWNIKRKETTAGPEVNLDSNSTANWDE